MPATEDTDPIHTIATDLEARRNHGRSMGGAERVARHKAGEQEQGGRLTVRDRVDALLDMGSFFEVGLLNHSDMPGICGETPADGKVAGFGTVDGRPVAVIGNDATTLAGAGGRSGARKMDQVSSTAFEKGYPLILFAESGGGRIPDILTPVGIISYPSPPGAFGKRQRRVPLVTAIMGNAFGESAFSAAQSDLVVQVKGTCMAVSSPRALEIATTEKVTAEELGGWEVHAKVTGLADQVADTDADAIALVRDFLSYMPSHNDALPPRSADRDDPAADRQGKLASIIPTQPRRGYDMRAALRILFDHGRFLELKPLFDRSVITALARLDGHTVGVVANNPLGNGGAMGFDGADKITSFIILCDSFNIPLVFLCDTPGFFVSRKAEERRMAGRISTQWVALSAATVPKVSVVLRKAYGAGYFSMGGPRMGMDWHFAWPTADIGFVAPEVAVNIAHARKLREPDADPELRETLIREMRAANSPWEAAGHHYIHDVIAPHERAGACRHPGRGRRKSADARRDQGSSENHWPGKAEMARIAGMCR
ncbi:acetyl-CoA carboxylase carboxyltransferase component [Sphingobium wenxiniae]|uniref:Acetyl-CoA carboxylase carboxyltransferase component n=1 Tax=Sphingobium wenxiniae (strain DSM 21828 / CGMCC 1.7748 / JZ-1) TaxID=595605 RepID=A0A562KD01_SPHWJ|nr:MULTISPECIES: carboxyl transferase domain-containing protein [Sphingobium]MBB6191421.1 acetyl-CoA carboxylase carboxyltransferase component [Sphingobium wenxiniae]TWH93286.1 acetyl-CoA carboxylase carboxyltransferase component [Sphingobium wenxiniae]WRD76174.1 carboxyl transferase domain-containing protein [Sphingobium baderi]